LDPKLCADKLHSRVIPQQGLNQRADLWLSQVRIFGQQWTDGVVCCVV
jgi:hypothetical protein